MEMLSRHNEGKIQLDEDEKEILAMQAKRLGEKFSVESKPFSKGAFDAADMATFGLVPNKWRPRSAGQDLYGETGYDKFAGGVGSIAGLATGVGGAIKGGRMGWAALKKAFLRKKSDDIASNLYKGNLIGQGSPLSLRGRPTPQLGPGPNIPQLGQGSPLSLRGAPQQLGPAVRPGDVGRSLAEQKRRLDEAIAALRSNPYAQSMGVQQGGYIPGYQEGGDVDPYESIRPATPSAGTMNLVSDVLGSEYDPYNKGEEFLYEGRPAGRPVADLNYDDQVNIRDIVKLQGDKVNQYVDPSAGWERKERPILGMEGQGSMERSYQQGGYVKGR